jgi:hypothetical protein
MRPLAGRASHTYDGSASERKHRTGNGRSLEVAVSNLQIFKHLTKYGSDGILIALVRRAAADCEGGWAHRFPEAHPILVSAARRRRRPPPR